MTPRSLALASVLAVSLLGSTVAPQTALAQEEPIKIAVVNMDQVIAQSAAGSALNEKLKAFQQEAQGQVEEQQKRIQELRQKVSDGVNSEDQAQLLNLQKQFEDASLQLRRFRDDKAREAQKIQSEGLQEIEKQFEPVFAAIQEEFDYDLILNQQSGVVMMVGERINITQTVIDRLQ
ncbi:OmpH family outer membrane protein [uncultured Roseovarius sp.]|uniref:OmpH family outer membrane protein n=1 Tax=uncultured Roseovarius sp. TaxID=293344 RepID=UPI00261D01AB|nr:OmpH family outer membrane protein [uncultured Roseovarius sp.]